MLIIHTPFFLHYAIWKKFLKLWYWEIIKHRCCDLPEKHETLILRAMNGPFFFLPHVVKNSCLVFLVVFKWCQTCTSYWACLCVWVCVCVYEWEPGAFMLLLLHRQHGASRSSLTSSAGHLPSNTALMADKHVGFGPGRTTNGHIYVQGSAAKLSLCSSVSRFSAQAGYFHEM